MQRWRMTSRYYRNNQARALSFVVEISLWRLRFPVPSLLSDTLFRPTAKSSNSFDSFLHDVHYFQLFKKVRLSFKRLFNQIKDTLAQELWACTAIGVPKWLLLAIRQGLVNCKETASSQVFIPTSRELFWTPIEIGREASFSLYILLSLFELFEL